MAGVRSLGSAARLLAGRPSAPVTVQLRNGCPFRGRIFMALWITKETCLDRDYEGDLPAYGEDWTIIDIGAGLGDFSVCAAWRHPQRKIAAFEPFRESFDLLQEALRKAGFARCDLLKVDCEGGEYDIFFNAPEATLRKIERIAMEYHDGFTPHSHTELAAFLRGHGFSVTPPTHPVHAP